VLADRFDKRRLLMATQVVMAVPALALFALAVSGLVEAWMVIALAFVRGTVNSIDNPTRQSFVIEMVGTDRVVNAVALNSVIVQCARMLGPAIAGLIIATSGVDLCFLLNMLTFVAMFVALAGMHTADLRSPKPVPREPGALRAALRYVAASPSLALPLAMMAVIGMLAFNFQVLLPLLAKFTFDGGPGSYSALVTAMAVGSVAGALVAGARQLVTPRLLIGAAAAFGVFTSLAAVAPTLELEALALVPVGAASVTFAAGVNSSLQLAVDPAMRGRVMALYSVVFLGSTPIGGPLAGWLAESFGPRAGLVLGAVACFAAAGVAALALQRRGIDMAAGPVRANLTGALSTAPRSSSS
jgi:MFS family permease